MHNRTRVGLSVAVAGLLAVASFLTTSNDFERKPTSSAPTEDQSEPVSVNTAIAAQPVPAQKLDPAPPTPNYSTALTDAPQTPSPNRKLLASPAGEDIKRLVRSMRLDANSSEKLLDILADEAKRTQEWLAANRRSFLTNDEGLALRAESNALAMDLLGDAKFRLYDEYRNHRLERGPIDRLNERLGDGWAPQEIDDALYGVIKEETSRNPAPRLVGFDSYSDFAAASRKWREENRKRIEERAATILSGEQFELLQKLLR